MMLSTKKQYILSVTLLVLIGGVVFFFVSPVQDIGESALPEDTMVQSSVPSRAPVGYEVPARPEVIFPFTHVSADRLRLGNVREVDEGRVTPKGGIVAVVYPENYSTKSTSPDGQWVLLSISGLSITRTDGSGETHVLFTEMREQNESISIYTGPFSFPAWSWDSSRVFYKVERKYYLNPNGLGVEYERWIESVDITTGEVTHHPDTDVHDDLHSYATARYPNDPILSHIPSDYQKGLCGIKTYDGSASWIIDGFIPISLSPNKRLVFGYEADHIKRTETGNVRRYLIYAIDGTGPLYSFYLDGDTGILKWSPDSSKFAYDYIIEREDGTGIPSVSDIYIINIDSTGKTNLTNTPDTPEYFRGWTPDGQIVFGIARGKSYLADLIIE